MEYIAFELGRTPIQYVILGYVMAIWTPPMVFILVLLMVFAIVHTWGPKHAEVEAHESKKNDESNKKTNNEND